MGGVPEIAEILRNGRATLTSVGNDQYRVDVGVTRINQPNGDAFVLDFAKIAPKPSRAGIGRKVARFGADVIDRTLEKGRATFYSGEAVYGFPAAGLLR